MEGQMSSKESDVTTGNSLETKIEKDCDPIIVSDENEGANAGNKSHDESFRKEETMSMEKEDETNLLLNREGSSKDEEITPAVSSEDKDSNSLCNVVTMHMSNCDEDYSPTLAICDIFNKQKSSPYQREVTETKAEENKDEFLIIDLDTCQMEKTSLKVKENDNVSKSDFFGHTVEKKQKSPSKDLILVNLSAQEEPTTDFLNTPVVKTKRVNSNSHDEEIVHSKQSCAIAIPAQDQSVKKQDEKQTEGKGIHSDNIKETSVSNEKQSLKEDKSVNHSKLYAPTIAEIRRNNCKSKRILFEDTPISDDPIASKDSYSTVSFHSSDFSDFPLQSNENQDNQSEFCIPGLCTRYYGEKDSDHSSYTFPKLPSMNIGSEHDNINPYYEYSFNENPNFDIPLSTSQSNNSMLHDFYEPRQSQSSHQYNFEDKIMSSLMAMDTKTDTSFTYGSSHQQESTSQYFYKSNANANNSNRSFTYSPNSLVQERPSANPFFTSPYLSNYRTSNPYSSTPQAMDTIPSLLTSQSNSSDWNAWSSSAFYEVNLNSFSSLHNTDSQYYPLKEDWSQMTDLYHDPQLGVKSSQTEIDSEATEDADETDDAQLFLEDSTDFSTCDNISTMSVMSGSCYSDTSSVMAPISPSDFTPPPSASNTPIPTNYQDINANDSSRFTYQFNNDNSYSEPLHLYSPTMLSVATPYKLTNEKIDQNLMPYGRGQGFQRYYPSMADKHHARTGSSLATSLTKFQGDEMFDISNSKKSSQNQIQSDAISTSTFRNSYNPITTSPELKSVELYPEYVKQEKEMTNESRRLRHNEPLKQTAIKIMSQWYEEHLENPYPTKEDKMRMARKGGITVTQVKSWFANKRNRTNNTKPKVQKRAMKEKLKKLFQDLKHSRPDSVDNMHIIQQLSGIIQT